VYVGRVVGNHRTATGDFDGDGHVEAVAVPLFSEGVEPYYGYAEIVLCEPPRPWSTTQEWPSSTLSSGFFINPHDVAVIPGTEANGNKDALLISSHEGLYRVDITRSEEDGTFGGELTQLHGPPTDLPSDASARCRL